MEHIPQSNAPGVVLDPRLGKIFEHFSIDTGPIIACLESHGVPAPDIAGLKIAVSADAAYGEEAKDFVDAVYIARQEEEPPVIALFAGQALNIVRTGVYGMSGFDRSLAAYARLKDFCQEENLPIEPYFDGSPIGPDQYPVAERMCELRLDAVLRHMLAFHVLHTHPEGARAMVVAQRQRERAAQRIAEVTLPVGEFFGAHYLAAFAYKLGAAAITRVHPYPSLLRWQNISQRACCLAGDEFPLAPTVQVHYREDYAKGVTGIYNPDSWKYPSDRLQRFFNALYPFSPPKEETEGLHMAQPKQEEAVNFDVVSE
jgi:hypothetical protein